MSSPIAHSDSVTIVVHGVGDHHEVDMLTEAKRGFDSLSATESSAKDIAIADFSQDGEQPALLIHAKDSYHILIPIAWSYLRKRAANQQALTENSLTGATVTTFLSIIRDVSRCFPKAADRWKMCIALLALILVAIIVGLVMGLAFLQVTLMGFYVSAYGSLGYAIDIFVMYLVVVLVRKFVLSYIDFAGDIAFYIGRIGAREKIEEILLTRIERVAAMAPRAKILLVGHSLGSVITTQSLLRIDRRSIAAGRTLSLTLGSPLSLLARVFPGYVKSPSELVARYTTDGAIVFWGNLWRDRDFVGRDLHPAIRTGFAEKSLGDGPHWNMWSSERLWEEVYSVIVAAKRNSLDVLKQEWDADTLTEDDRAHMERMFEAIQTARTFALLHGALLFFCGCVVYFRWRLPDLNPLEVKLLYIFSATGLCVATAMFVASWYGLAGHPQLNRGTVGHLHRWGSRCSLLWKINTYLVGANLILIFAAMSNNQH